MSSAPCPRACVSASAMLERARVVDAHAQPLRGRRPDNRPHESLAHARGSACGAAGDRQQQRDVRPASAAGGASASGCRRTVPGAALRQLAFSSPVMRGYAGACGSGIAANWRTASCRRPRSSASSPLSSARSVSASAENGSRRETSERAGGLLGALRVQPVMRRVQQRTRCGRCRCSEPRALRRRAPLRPGPRPARGSSARSTEGGGPARQGSGNRSRQPGRSSAGPKSQRTGTSVEGPLGGVQDGR